MRTLTENDILGVVWALHKKLGETKHVTPDKYYHPLKNDWGAGFKILCVLKYSDRTKAFGFSQVRPRQFCLARSEQHQDH